MAGPQCLLYHKICGGREKMTGPRRIASGPGGEDNAPPETLDYVLPTGTR